MRPQRQARLPAYQFDLGSHWRLIEVNGEKFIERLETPQKKTEAVTYPGSTNPADTTPSSEYLTYQNRSIGVPSGEGELGVDEEVSDEDDALLDSLFEDNAEQDEEDSDISGSSSAGHSGPTSVGQPLSSFGR